MKKVFALGLTAALAVTALVGCGGGKTEPTTAASATAESAAKTETSAMAEVDRSQQLIIYSNSASNGRGDWLKERAAKEGFNIEAVPIPGGDLTNRLIAEKNNTQADMVFGLNALEYEKLKKENLLVKYEPTWAKDVDMSLGDAQGYYYPIVVQPLVMMYNNELTDVPSDWTDLVDPKYTDQYTMLPLGGGTGKTILASILIRYADPKGKDGISDEGWDMAKKIFQNGHMQIEGEDSVGDVISKKRPMSTMWGSGVLQNQTERNYKFGIMSPEVGVPYVVEQVAIVSGTKKQALAQDFANWFGQADVQAEWSKQFGTIPAQPKAMEEASADVKEFMKQVHSQDIDWSVVSENIDKWVERVELEYIQ